MELDPDILKLSNETLTTSNVTGDRIALTARVNEEEFKSLYKEDMREAGLNPAKALYIAMTHTGSKLSTFKETLYSRAAVK